MPLNTETIPPALGKIYTGLTKEGFTTEQAYQIVLDLIRRGDSPSALVE